MLLTLPGLPALYTGDEVGAEFQPYRLGPPVDWEDLHGLRNWYKRLLLLRRTYPALHGRQIRMLDLAPADRVLAYVRPAANAADDILVLLNYGPEPTRVRLPSEVHLPAGTSLVDLLSGETVKPGRDGNLPLPGYGARILRRD
jgi:cyclomaltodextrinase / maltogenic alpha-amylase / neopullulanase